MATTNPSQLFLLADHVKLSLLERQRAISMNLDSSSQDGHISRSMDTLGSGIETLENQLVETPNSYVTPRRWRDPFSCGSSMVA
jgi:syntaxin 8